MSKAPKAASVSSMPFTRFVIWAFWSCRNRSTFSWSRGSGPSMLTDITVNPCGAYFFASASVCGNALRQGRHQVAQKSTSTTFPFFAATIFLSSSGVPDGTVTRPDFSNEPDGPNADGPEAGGREEADDSAAPKV